MQVKYTDEGIEKTKEDCCPGQPFVTFYSSPGIKIECINPTPMNGLFTQEVLISNGDTVNKIKSKILKDSKSMKGNINSFHRPDSKSLLI